MRTFFLLIAIIATVLSGGVRQVGLAPDTQSVGIDMGRVTISLDVVRLGPETAPPPEAGGALSAILGYDKTLWAIHYSCSWAGWESGTKSWSCDLFASG